MKIYILCQYCATKKEIAFKLIEAQTSKRSIKEKLKGEYYRSTKGSLRISKSDIDIPTFIVLESQIKHKPKPGTIIGVIFKWSAWKKGNSYEPVITIHSVVSSLITAFEFIDKKMPDAKVSPGTYDGIAQEYLIYENKTPILWCVGPTTYMPLKAKANKEKSLPKPIRSKPIIPKPVRTIPVRTIPKPIRTKPVVNIPKYVNISDPTLYEEKQEREEKSPMYVSPKPVLQKKSLSRPKPVLQKKSLSRPKPVMQKKSLSRPKPVMQKKSLSRPKPVLQKKSSQASNYLKAPFTLDTEEYFTHDNGANPYRVLLIKNKAEIFQDRFARVGYFTIRGAFIGGKGIKEEEGNSLLVKLESRNRYAFIGNYIAEFETPNNDEVVAFYSPVGNNDVPYPVAVGKKYVYFFLDGQTKYVPIGSFDHIGKDPTWAHQAYKLLFEGQLGGVKELNMKYVLKRFQKSRMVDDSLVKLLEGLNQSSDISVLNTKFIIGSGWGKTSIEVIKVLLDVKDIIWDYYYVNIKGYKDAPQGWQLFQEIHREQNPYLEIKAVSYNDREKQLEVLYEVKEKESEWLYVYDEEARRKKWRLHHKVEG